MDNFSGKVVLITGSSRGIGRGIAVEFAKRGAKLSLTGRDVGMLQETAALCQQAGADKNDILQTTGDLTEDAFLTILVEKTVEKFAQVDVVVNNAALGLNCAVQETSIDDFDKLHKANVRAPFLLTKLLIPHLIKSKGSVVNISSMAGTRPVLAVSATYSMTKAAINMFTQALALELGPHGVRVNAVSPGYIKTDIHVAFAQSLQFKTMEQYYEMVGSIAAIDRVGTIEEVVPIVLFLASDASSFMTGTNSLVDGGVLITKPKAASK